jgi:hypothetical protein
MNIMGRHYDIFFLSAGIFMGVLAVVMLGTSVGIVWFGIIDGAIFHAILGIFLGIIVLGAAAFCAWLSKVAFLEI